MYGRQLSPLLLATLWRSFQGYYHRISDENDRSVVLYDFNRAMMELGQAKVIRTGMARHFSFIEGDAEKIAVRDHTFDAAMVGFGIRNLTSMEQGLRELHRVLKTNGRLMILEFSQPTNPWFRALYNPYSFAVMPLVGKIMVSSWEAYTYLAESIAFSHPQES
jgi:demethylmenaquinone methyltransferase/2-methoxy-6-polyprenyl-1,4-benzoquinol methylase